MRSLKGDRLFAVDQTQSTEVTAAIRNSVDDFGGYVTQVISQLARRNLDFADGLCIRGIDGEVKTPQTRSVRLPAALEATELPI